MCSQILRHQSTLPTRIYKIILMHAYVLRRALSRTHTMKV